ncbi:MAG TPA: transglycosylase SLT domain-containing protein [Thermoanaerobaculia bacterium]|jgi:soluble lytic murein transglycosylase|nr:transglycosylase SLT domain-containing protein [Thermoanaerobaculia bacterium]
MLAALALLAAVTAADPRPALVELQLQDRPKEALALTQKELQEHPEASRQMGLDYLRGHLHDQLGDPVQANEAFGAALANTPDLGLYSRYRMAQEQAEMSHPEVAAGLVAWVVSNGSGSPLAPDAVRLFTRSLAQGGDCRLLHNIVVEKLATAERRSLLLAQADCALRGGLGELARNLLVRLLEENRQDDPGRAAAERLAGLVAEGERGRAPMLLGQTFQVHGDLGRGLAMLKRALGGGDALSQKQTLENLYVQARAQFSQQSYGAAAVLFGQIANQTRSLRERARALFQQGRSYELKGDWRPAITSFQMAYLAEPSGEWSAQALLSILRLEWRMGDEAAAATMFYTLAGRPEWNAATFRAGLFMTASDVARGRADRAHAWLDRLLAADADDRLELAYWRGRLAELEPDEVDTAVAAYLDVLRADPYHPLARLARARLAAEPLARGAGEEGRRLAASRRPQDLYGAWLLLSALNHRDETAQAARRRLLQILTADRATAPWVSLSEMRISRWPMWTKPLTRPEEKLLALGLWHEGAAAVPRQFPVTQPSLGLTGSLFLARGGEHSLSIRQAEALRDHTPARVPLAIQPHNLHIVLYPFPYREILLTQARLRGVDPNLLAGLVREESRFDAHALSPEAARGLTQLPLPAARRVAGMIGLKIEPDDLFRPETSAALGAAALAGLLHDFDGNAVLAVAAYPAGEPETLLWRSYCYGPGALDEMFTKIGADDIRAYVRRVLTSQAHYEELY